MGMFIIPTKDYMEEVAVDRYAAYGNFLDRFRWTITNEERQEVIKYPPDNSDKFEIDAAKLAATVECLAKDFGLEIPEWVYEERFILKEPYYARVTTECVRKFLEETSLPEFAKRNLFLGDNVMDRA